MANPDQSTPRDNSPAVAPEWEHYVLSRYVADVFETLAHRSVNLRHAAQAIGVLNTAAVEVRLPDFTFAQKSGEPPGHFELSPVRASFVDTHVEGDGRAFQCFE